jgi:hypothetical protein
MRLLKKAQPLFRATEPPCVSMRTFVKKIAKLVEIAPSGRGSESAPRKINRYRAATTGSDHPGRFFRTLVSMRTAAK